MLLWQDMPLLGTYKGVRRQAVRQASAAVGSLGHHPSIIVWCGHSEPFAPAATVAGMKRSHRALRWTARQVLPTPNKSLLDRSIRRALERADPSRPAVAHSGVLPHPAWGTGSHLYFGWYYGRASDLSRVASGWPSAVRFVSEFGAQAVPTSASFMEPERWPDLDWERLVAHHCMQKAIFDERVPPLGYDDFGAWRQATQDYQAHLVRFQVETLRRLRDQLTGGFAVACLNDSQPAVSHSMLDSERIPKAAFAALQAACSPVLVAADWPAPSYRPGTRASFAVHVVNDTREDLVGAVLDARLSWPGGGRRWRLGGEAGACACSFVGRVAAVLPQRDELVRARPAAPVPVAGGLGAAVPVPGWPLNLDLELSWGEPGHSVANRYSSAIVA